MVLSEYSATLRLGLVRCGNCVEIAVKHAVLNRRAFVQVGFALGAAFPAVASAQTPTLTIETKFSPQVPPDMLVRLQTWADAVKSKTAVWWPIIVTSLSSPGFVMADHLTLSFYRIDNPNVPAITTTGPTINVDPWKLIVRLNNPDTFGMVAHELVHVAQSYPQGAGPVWIREGVADYMRYYALLLDDPGRYFDPRGVTERTGYQPTAGLLDWVEKSHPGAIRQINRAMREGEDGAEALAEIGGDAPDRLWSAYLASHPRAADGAAAARRARAIHS